MTTKASNHGKGWTSAEVKALKELIQQNTPTRVIGLKLGRTAESVRSKAGTLGVSLKPTNQAPYSREDT